MAKTGMKPTLVIMAAGMGSRFGGLKQIEPVDPEGHIIIDFSLFDAWRAGFRDVVFIIKREMEEEFRQCIGDRMERYFRVSYVFQNMDRLPDGISVPEGRTKPWGTGHAVACCKGVVIEKNHGGDRREIKAETVVIATGRRGADELEKMCARYDIAHRPGTVDIGVRVEVRNEVMEEVNEVLYESKLIGYPNPFRNKVRTFCQNPGGFVSQENYDNDLAVVNGHSYKKLKSDNTNVAILCSHNFTSPFNQPIAYAQKVGELTNMLGDGRIMVQRYGDILDGKRTWEKELMQSNVKPTLVDAVAGDITAAMPYRAMINIINFIQAVDHVVPGFAGTETLLYSPELKFYSNKVRMDENLRTNVKNLYCLGDSSGWTRGLMMASVMGVYMARKLLEEAEAAE